MIDANNRVLIDSEESQQALLFLNDLVFNYRISENPYNGDFSTKAIFSRKRYSSIRELIFKIGAGNIDISEYFEKEKEKHCGKLEWIGVPSDKVGVLNLPKVSKKKKSYSAYDVYCLGIVKEALSPEIGWIFIDSLTHPEWIKKRAKARVGFPVKDEYLKNSDITEHDPKSYKAVDRIIDPGNSDYSYKTREDIPIFYKLETIIHDGIKRLFVPEERKKLFTVNGVDKSRDHHLVKQKIIEILEDLRAQISRSLEEHGY